MRKILVPVLNRATYGRLKSVLKAIHEHPDLELQVVMGASLFDAQIEFPVLYRIQCMVEGDNLAIMPLTTSMWIAQLTGIIENLNPDAVYIHGDRFESLGTALTAAYLNKIVAHGEGGDISSSIDERIRHAITKLADLHFPVTELSRQRIIKMGERPEMVFTVGSTALDPLVGIDLTNNRKEPYILVLHHPNTTAPEDIMPLIEAVMSIPIHKVWVNPNIDPGSRSMLKLIHKQDVEFIKNLPPEEYARLLKNCQCAVGNSSSFIKEAAFLGVPAVLVGSRQEGREVGNNVQISKNKRFSIEASIHYQLGNKPKPDYRFGNGIAGKQIADILAKVEVKEKKLTY